MPQLEAIYKGPWKGMDTSMPETDIDPSATPFAVNFIVRKGEIRSRPQLSLIALAPPDFTPTIGLTAFVDSNGVVHTVALTQYAGYQLSSAFSQPNYRGNPWLPIFNFPALQNNVPWAISNLNTKLYFSNGTQYT